MRVFKYFSILHSVLLTFLLIYGPLCLFFSLQLTEPLSKRFMAQVHRPNFASTCHDSATQLELLSIVEVLCGLTDASTGSAVQLLFPFLLPLLKSCVSLMEAYSNTQAMCVSVLTLFNLVSENFTIFLEDVSIM